MNAVIRMGQTRTYGTLTQSFEVSINRDIVSDLSTCEAEAELWKMLDLLFSQFETQYLKRSGGSIGGAATSAATNGSPENIVLPAVSLIKKQDGERVFYRVLTPQGTKFGKFGVPIYSEVMEKYKLLDWMGASASEKFPEGCRAVISADGKRVLEITGLEID